MMEYLDSVGAEEVNQLARRLSQKNIEGEWLTKAEARADSNRSRSCCGKYSQAQRQLAEAEKYIKWLKQEAIFTRERMAMSEGSK